MQKQHARSKQASKRGVIVKVTDKKDAPKALAQMLLDPGVNAAAVVQTYAGNTTDINAYVEVLSEHIKKVTDGDLGQVEGMLLGQAHALQSIFMNFAHRAKSQDYLSHMESFMRMALKAQNQCRMTLETLANVKNPPVVIARQANIAHGPQQVNNGVLPGKGCAISREEKPIQSNELLEAIDDKRMDIGAACSASRINPTIDAVETIDRPKNRKRKDKVSS